MTKQVCTLVRRLSTTDPNAAIPGAKDAAAEEKLRLIAPIVGVDPKKGAKAILDGCAALADLGESPAEAALARRTGCSLKELAMCKTKKLDPVAYATTRDAIAKKSQKR